MAKPNSRTNIPPSSLYYSPLCGDKSECKKRVTTDLLLWSDIICVMEQQHKNRLITEYRQAIASKPLPVLDIPDDYRFMDPELIAMITDIVTDKPGLYA